MSLYVVEGIRESVYVGVGEMLTDAVLTFVYENQMPAAYIASQMGMTVESQPAAIRVKAGEFVDTEKGDFIIVEHTHTTEAGEVRQEETVQVDVGQGLGHLQAVIPLSEEAEEEDELGPVEYPFYSESAVSTNPYESQYVENYVPPETPSDDVTYIASGAPVTYQSGGQSYTYTASGTASATQDLVGYGELDVNGNPVQTYDPYANANLAAAYDGV